MIEEQRWSCLSDPLKHRLFEAIMDWLSTDTDAGADHLFQQKQQVVVVRAERYALSQGWLPPEEMLAPPARPLPGQLALPFANVMEATQPRRGASNLGAAPGCRLAVLTRPRVCNPRFPEATTHHE